MTWGGGQACKVHFLMVMKDQSEVVILNPKCVNLISLRALVQFLSNCLDLGARWEPVTNLWHTHTPSAPCWCWIINLLISSLPETRATCHRKERACFYSFCSFFSLKRGACLIAVVFAATFSACLDTEKHIGLLSLEYWCSYIAFHY